MKKKFVFLVGNFAIGCACASMPVFVANCPNDISVDAGRDGVARVNGRNAKIRKVNDKYYDLKVDDVTISVVPNSGGPPDVTYAGTGNANVICAVTGFEDGKAKVASDQQQARIVRTSTAKGTIPCAQAKGQPMGQCLYTVEREGKGTAMVKVIHPDGRMRVIFFEKGKATGTDLSQADGDMTFGAGKQDDLFMIQTGKERYEIPDAVVFGG